MQLPSLSPKQQAILHFLYLYRFLTRQQLQTLLRHKSKHRLSLWLKDLRERQYVGWMYSPSQFSDRSKPAVYFLMSGGIRYLSKVGGYPSSELNLRYHDARRSRQFIDTHIVLADCTIRLPSPNQTLIKDGSVLYGVFTRAEVANPQHALHGLIEGAAVRPHLLILKQHGPKQKIYFLEMLNASSPRYDLRRKLQRYVECMNYTDNLLAASGPSGVLLVLPSRAGLRAAKRVARSMVGNDHHAWLLFAVTADVKQYGIDAAIWEEL